MKLRNLKKTITVSAFGLIALLATNITADAQGRRQGQKQQPKQVVNGQQKSAKQPAAVVNQRRGVVNQRQQVATQRENSYNQDQNRANQRAIARRQAVANQRAAAQHQALANQRAAFARQQALIRQQQIRLQQQRQAQLRRQAQYNNRYRVNQNGRYYQTDYRGAELLKQAVNEGYRQGFLAGQYDSSHRRSYKYNSSSMYNNGNYGYQSYVDSRLYQHYFQQGFQKGYEDGYSKRYKYGTYNNGNRSILGTILGAILKLERY